MQNIDKKQNTFIFFTKEFENYQNSIFIINLFYLK